MRKQGYQLLSFHLHVFLEKYIKYFDLCVKVFEFRNDRKCFDTD